MIGDPGFIVSRAATFRNESNLAPEFIAEMKARYQGTRLGRQELSAEIIADDPDALFRRDWIEAKRVAEVPELRRIVVAIDPPGSAGKESSACGLVAAGRHGDLVYVLADGTAAGLSPAGWANKAIALWRSLEADCLVVLDDGLVVFALLGVQPT